MASDDPMMHEDAESIGALFTRLVEDGKDYARAETDYYRALALDRWRIARPGVAAMGAVLVLAIGIVIALFVGLLLTLATLIGPGLATVAVVLGAALLAALLIWFAAQRLEAAFAPLQPDRQSETQREQMDMTAPNPEASHG